MTTLLFLGFCLRLYWDAAALSSSDIRVVFTGVCVTFCLDVYLLICFLKGSR